MPTPNYKSINQYAARRQRREAQGCSCSRGGNAITCECRETRTAPTQPPPPDAAEHILKRVAEKRALIARLTREADELEAVALRMRGVEQ